jgi:putative inorganic carbon (hco3(-)) transporter
VYGAPPAPPAFPAVLASVEGSAGAGEKVALVALTLLVAAAVLMRPTGASRGLRATAMGAAALLTPLLLAINVWDTSQMRHLRNHLALLAPAVLAALALVAALAVLFRRRAWAFPVAVVLTLPFRVPIKSAGSTANLLVPLYAVVAAGVIAHCMRLLRPDPVAGPELAAGAGSGEHGSQDAEAPRRVWRRLSGLTSPRALEWLLLASVVLYGIQAAYSDDFSKALQNVAFFYVPFALMLCLLIEVRWTQELLSRCAAISVVLAVIFAAVGFVEYALKSLLLNSSLVASNVYGNYFRVNSVFYDPNIYGRYLALVMLLLACGALSATRREHVLLCAGALAWLWAGLLTSISQTSIVALLAGLAVLAGWRWGARRAAYAAAAIAALGVVVLLAAPTSLHFGLTGKAGSADNATSGRTNLVRGGIDLFADRPLAGFGSGSFSSQYRAHQAAGVASSTSASHTIPITVAAEQGIVGLALYVALLLCCFGVLFARAGRAPPPKPDARLRRESPFRPAIAACFAALFVHTLAYADFLEDPITWALLGIGMALAAEGLAPSGRSARSKAAAAYAMVET